MNDLAEWIGKAEAFLKEKYDAGEYFNQHPGLSEGGFPYR